MPPKKRKDGGTKDEKFVYVLTLKSVSQFDDDSEDQDPEIVGVYGSKAAAVAASGEIDCSTSKGTFDEVIDEVIRDGDDDDDDKDKDNDSDEDKDDDEGPFIDNRKNPPDDGCLLKVYNTEYGHGDYDKLIIQKFPVQDKAPTRRKKKKK